MPPKKQSSSSDAPEPRRSTRISSRPASSLQSKSEVEQTLTKPAAKKPVSKVSVGDLGC